MISGYPEPPAPLGPIDVERLRSWIGPEQYKSWFEPLWFVGIANGVVTLSTPNRYVASQISVRFGRPLLDCSPIGTTRINMIVVRQ